MKLITYNDILKEVPNEWEKYETIIGNKFDRPV